MKIKLVRHLWGVDFTRDFAYYAPHWREVGYEAVEVSLRLVPDQGRFLRFSKGGVVPVGAAGFQPRFRARRHGARASRLRCREQMEECLDTQPLFFNAHSGCDTWSPAEAEDFYGDGWSWNSDWACPSRTKRTDCAVSAPPGRRGTFWKDSPI